MSEKTVDKAVKGMLDLSGKGRLDALSLLQEKTIMEAAMVDLTEADSFILVTFQRTEETVTTHFQTYKVSARDFAKVRKEMGEQILQQLE